MSSLIDSDLQLCAPIKLNKRHEQVLQGRLLRQDILRPRPMNAYNNVESDREVQSKTTVLLR